MRTTHNARVVSLRSIASRRRSRRRREGAVASSIPSRKAGQRCAPATQPLELRVAPYVLQTRGLRVESIAGNVEVEVQAVDSSEAVGGTVDLVIVCTKAWQVRVNKFGSMLSGIASLRPYSYLHLRHGRGVCASTGGRLST